MSNIVVYDLEMACFPDRKEVGEIIEIGAVMVNLSSREVVAKSSVIVKPQRDEITPFCTELTGITQRMVDKQGIPLDEAMRRISGKYSLSKNYWFAWGKDLSTLYREFHEKGILDKYPLDNFVNIAALFKLIANENKNLSQQSVCDIFGVDMVKPAHRALPDAENLAKLILSSITPELKMVFFEPRT